LHLSCKTSNGRQLIDSQQKIEEVTKALKTVNGELHRTRQESELLIKEVNHRNENLAKELAQEREGKQKSQSLYENFQQTSRQYFEELNSELNKIRKAKFQFQRNQQESCQQQIDHLMGELFREKREKERLEAEWRSNYERVTKDISMEPQGEYSH